MGAGHSHALYVHEHSPIHRLPSQVKIASVVSFVFLVAVTPRQAFWGFLVHVVALGALVIVSKVGIRFVLLRMMGILPFIAFAFLIPFVAAGERIDVLGVGVSREGLWAAWNIVAKASLGAAASILLAGTTEVPDILSGMARLKVPAVFTSIAGFMIRYLELIVAELGRMRIAMTSRGYDPRWLWQARPLATSAGALFVRSYERGERVYEAMLSRGFTGSMPDLRRRDPSAADWAMGSALPLLALVILSISRWPG